MTAFDITTKIGPLFPRPEAPSCPMYSYDRPAYILWNAIGRTLAQHGWTERQIMEWLSSKEPRWALDGVLGDVLEQLGIEYAQSMLQSAKR